MTNAATKFGIGFTHCFDEKDPMSAACPGEQRMHWAEPIESANVLKGQAEHSLAPSASLKVPIEQSSQLEALLSIP